MTTAAPAWQAPTSPQAHASDASATDAYRDAPAMPAIISQAPREVRGWRARTYASSAGPLAEPGSGLDATQDERAAAHARPGNPDPNGRELWDAPSQAGNPGHIRESLTPIPTVTGNQPGTPTTLTPSAAPTRPRQGFTGEDNTRTASVWRWLFLRPFDQWAERHPGTLDKHPSAAPTAARPPQFGQDVPGAVPSPGGGMAAPGMTPAGTQPNSVRILPRAWDALLVNDGHGQPDGSAHNASAQRARGWRL